MFNIVAKMFLIFASLVASQVAISCSCAPRDFGDPYRDSDVVYFAEVVMVRLVTVSPRHDSQATYEIQLRPVRIFKGRDPGIQKASFRSTYHDKSPYIPGPNGELREISIDSCDMRYEIGEVFLILKKNKEPLGEVGYCSRRFVHNPTAEHIRILEGLSP